MQPKRCSWVNVDQNLMRDYHDREWGVPTHGDRRHFEFRRFWPFRKNSKASTRTAGNS